MSTVMTTDQKKSISAIFGDMDYEEKSEYVFAQHNEHHFSNDSFTYCVTIEEAIAVATKAQDKWGSVQAVTRADFLLKIFSLSENSKELFRFINENEFLLAWDYFKYYSGLVLLPDEDSNENYSGIVFLSLQDAPLYIVTAAVSAALTAGNSVILQNSNLSLLLLLSKVFSKCNIPKGWLSVMTKTVESKDLSEKIKKVIFFGSYSAAQDVYINSSSLNFSFLCPNKTSTIILESCDVSAAVEKIVSETWDPDCASMWGVSTAVVQESIYETFLEKLQFRIKQLKIEKKNCHKFKNEIVCEKIKKITSKAIQAGAIVKECSNLEDEWSPTVILHYQSQLEFSNDAPILNVSVCRMAKEGVALLNNTRYCLGTSIWTEISSQALQIASMLVCKNIWINCHGVLDPSVPLSPSGLSGDCIFGGKDGIFEFVSPLMEISGMRNNSDLYLHNKFSELEIAQNAHNAFSKWLLEKNKLKYFKDAADSVEDDTERLKWFNIIFHSKLQCSCSGEFTPISQTDFYVVQRKAPIGVIAICVDFCHDNILSMIIPVIMLGNAVVLVVERENQFLESLLKRLNKFIPKNLFNIIFGSQALIYLASDPNIEALWICKEIFSYEYINKIKSYSVKTLKHIWVMPKTASSHLIRKKCLKSQVIWLTKVDQFP